MGEFKGTQGPWRYDSETGCVISDVEKDEVGQDFILGVFAKQYDGLLIASAPELLEALQEMVAIVKKHTYPQPDKPSSTWGRMEAAEAVIAKAIGQ